MERKQKICVVVKAFLEHPTFTMVELAELPELKAIKVSEKNIPEYLNDTSIIHLFDIWTYNDVKNKLSQKLREEKGANAKHVEKSKPRISDDYEASSTKKITTKAKRRMDHIYTFTKIYLKYPKISCDRIAALYNQSNTLRETVTTDYVEECLMSKTCSNFFAENIWSYTPVFLIDDQQASKDKRTK